jgi:glucosylceramidase
VQPPNSGCPDCTGLVTIDEKTHGVTHNLCYYELGQVSKFVEPGAFRVGSTRFVTDYHRSPRAYGVTAGLDNAAFVNPDGERVLMC